MGTYKLGPRIGVFENAKREQFVKSRNKIKQFEGKVTTYKEDLQVLEQERTRQLAGRGGTRPGRTVAE